MIKDAKAITDMVIHRKSSVSVGAPWNVSSKDKPEAVTRGIVIIWTQFGLRYPGWKNIYWWSF